MADAITIKALQDASLDAKSLEEVVNGNESKQVTTRKGETYPSVKKAIKTLFENGGLPATPFNTKLEMEASELIEGGYAVVTDDTVADNNGLYVKAAGAWVKSNYDITNQAEIAVNDVFSGVVELDASRNIFEVKGGDGQPAIVMDEKGHLYLPHVDGTLQNALNAKTELDNSTAILDVIDSKGEAVAKIDSFGTLHVNDVNTSRGTIESRALSTIEDVLSKTKLPIDDNSNWNIMKQVEYLVNNQTESYNIKSTLVTPEEVSAASNKVFSVVFAPSIVRISEYEFYLTFDARAESGDYIPIAIFGCILTYNNDNKTIEKGDIKTLAMHGRELDETPYSFLNPNVTFVESGVNEGRILVHFNYMTNPSDPSERIFKPYYVYSDDGGANFSDPIDMSSMFPMQEFGGRLNFGPGHGIQLKSKEYKDRVILPAYISKSLTESGKYASICIYSDDGGDTYNYSEIIDSEGRQFNECQAVEQSDGSILFILRDFSDVSSKYKCISKDGGNSFSKPVAYRLYKGAGTKPALVSWQDTYDAKLNRVFAALARDENASGGKSGRINATLFVSYDEGETFSDFIQLDDKPCQYMDIVPLNKVDLLVLHGGATDSHKQYIRANIVNLNFIEGK